MILDLLKDIKQTAEKRFNTNFYGSDTIEINYIDGKIRNVNFMSKESRKYEK